MHSTTMPASCARIGARDSRARRRSRQRRRERHLDRETRATADASTSTSILWLEHARDALDDRQAEPQPARDLGALVEPVEFLEDIALVFDGGMPMPVS